LVKINGNDFFIGCDPEVFVVNKEGQFVGAHGLIPGTKTEPFKVKNGMVQVDGMALEFGVDPCENKREFIFKVNSVKSTLKKMLPKGYDLAVVPVAVFSDEEMARAPAEALELGCDPDYNGYTGRLNKAPKLANPNMRSAGGHVHTGWGSGFDRLDPGFIMNCAALAVELDYYLGAASLAWDKDNTRRSIYGAAGAFRPKPYGMEYRSLSNQWLTSDELIGFVFDNTVNALCSVMRDPMTNAPLSFYNGAVVTSAAAIINSNLVDLGEAVYTKLKRTCYV
jgi:hypothetical protein